jgi:serine/threonine-protein kinase
MIEPPIPSDEETRLALLRACKIMYTPQEQAFDDVAQLAADLCGAEIALITLVDADYQWFKAKVGTEHVGTPRDLSFCGHCIARAEPLIVEDTRLDPRFADNPLVTGDPFIRFYAGVPLEVDAGSSIGALSVADRAPRTLTPRQLAALRRLAQQVARELRLRRDLDRVRATTPPPTGLPVGEGALVGGRYRVARELGRGGVGAVFEAHDLDGQRVAIKLLLPEWQAHDQVVERFAREARVLMQLTTPHVGRLLDVGNLSESDGDLPFLVLEYLDGLDLDRLLRERGRLPYREAFALCADACVGVGEAHDLGVVHRDIKPSNVFLTSDAPPVVKVLDFGLATADPAPRSGGRLTNVNLLLGSPAYMSPEQMVASTDVDARSDIWSMGALLYEVVSGALPFPGAGPLEMFAAAMTRPPLPLRAHAAADVPFAAEEIVLRCLRKDRGDRFQSMASLEDALRAQARTG